MFGRKEDNKIIKVADEEFKNIIALFKRKSQSYGSDADVFFNFRMTALRLFGNDSYDSMFKVAEVYKDKHNVALSKGIHVPEVAERLRDNIVYSLIQLAMIEESEEMNNECED
ncbi:hypothetical protein [Veillonella magna]|uniref:hypothetical protein n=1 Tax=Veillonella magna TaxID=464322 RepID=UPI0023F3A51F|nr:hypothetical protein [Veillonella magna]